MSAMKRVFISIAILIGLAIGAVMLSPAPNVLASSTTDVCEGVNAAAGGSDCGDGGGDLNNIITVFLNLFSLVIGIAAVVMIMVSGFKYITSSGDSGSINSAKTTLIYAIIGLIIVALAQFLVQFVLDKAT